MLRCRSEPRFFASRIHLKYALMARALWPLHQGCPRVDVVLTLAVGGQARSRTLLADTGAGSAHTSFELLLDEEDCLLCGGIPVSTATLGGAYSGSDPLYVVALRIPALRFEQEVRVVAVPSPPAGFDGIACFKFLNRFGYGNFKRQESFGLENRNRRQPR